MGKFDGQEAKLQHVVTIVLCGSVEPIGLPKQKIGSSEMDPIVPVLTNG